MKRILFVCVHNSGRSLMAEAILNHRANDVAMATSAGTMPGERPNPAAVEALREMGVPTDGLSPKLLTKEMIDAADRVITMGCGVSESCPALLHGDMEDWGLDDPAGQPLDVVRRIRDQIAAKVDQLLKEIAAEEADRVRATVRQAYGQVALGGGGCCGPSSAGDCCGSNATAIGYSPSDLVQIPEGANLGLGCGNPVALASLTPGETVLDLGSGAGIDCFLAARRVGPTGRVIGVDMTPEMVAKARANARNSGLANVEFRLGEIEHLPVESGTVDVVISNCVLNLVPDKAQAFREIARVLRPGGRVMVSDIVKLRDLPPELANDPNLYCACVGGAVTKDEYLALMREAGLVNVTITSEQDAGEMLRGADGPVSDLLRTLPDEDVRGYAASIAVSAVKPG
jgi:protein-tyrosine-phosphatase/SAM-dependent methyltransferase